MFPLGAGLVAETVFKVPQTLCDPLFGIDKLRFGAVFVILAPTYDNLLLCIWLGAALFMVGLLFATDVDDCIGPDVDGVGRNVE